MSTKQEKQPHVLTAENGLFYGADKAMTDFGNKLKVYANLGSAKAATRMLAKSDNILTPIALADAKKADDAAKNGKVVEVTALPTSDEVLAKKEAEAFSKMLYVAYSHITDDPKVMEKIHNFTLSPVGKRVDFGADFIKTLLADYDSATKDAIIPENKKVLVAEISKLQEELGEYKDLFGSRPEKAQMLERLTTGIKATISPLQMQLAELPDENKVVFNALFLLPLCGRLFSEKALKPSTRGKNSDTHTWAMGEGQFLAFDYSGSRVCQNGLDLSKLGLASIQGFVYHPDHENVKHLSIPDKKLAVVSADHVMVATIDASLALGNVLGESIFEIVKPNVERARFVQAISSTGVDAFQSKKASVLNKTAKTVSADIIKSGQHSELETVGRNADTEKDHAPVE